VALSDDELATLRRLEKSLTVQSANDGVLRAYYKGQQRLRHMGLALPPEMQIFETVINWPRTYVDTLRARLRMRSLILPGEETADPGLREGYDANNLDSQSRLAHLDAFMYGRSFVTVGTNEDDREHPLIRVESPQQMATEVDPRTLRLAAAAKVYGKNEIGQATNATLYLPNQTIWLFSDRGRWVEVDRDVHNLGRVPVVMLINRPETGIYTGESEMTDVIPLTDGAARSLTNGGFAMETVAVPQKYVLGASKGDFVDADGNPIPAWESYIGHIWANSNTDAKVGQFPSADMGNFERWVNLFAQHASGVTGLPMRYFGQNSANPPSADGIRADESRLINTAQTKQDEFGDPWGWVFALYLKFRDGADVDGSRVKVQWFDPGTPTISALADSVQKQVASGLLSKRGAWTELGWSEARIAQEQQWMADEASDPLVDQLAKQFQAGAGMTDATTAGDGAAV
jgi:hypothetical protein